MSLSPREGNPAYGSSSVQPPSPGLLGLPCGGLGTGRGGGERGAAADQRGERGERTQPAFPPLSSPSPILDPGDLQLLGRWEAGGRGSPAQGRRD